MYVCTQTYMRVFENVLGKIELEDKLISVEKKLIKFRQSYFHSVLLKNILTTLQRYGFQNFHTDFEGPGHQRR